MHNICILFKTCAFTLNSNAGHQEYVFLCIHFKMSQLHFTVEATYLKTRQICWDILYMLNFCSSPALDELAG